MDPGSGLAPGQPLWVGGLDWSWAYVVFGGVRGFPGYAVGTDGTLWSRLNRGKGKNSDPPWVRLNPAPSTQLGHRSFGFRRGGQSFRITIHRIVLETFIGPCPPGMECCHNDGNPANNRVGNLRWDTSKANHADRLRHGRQPRGLDHYMGKLSTEDVAAIRRLIRLGVYHKEIAPIFGIHVSTVGQIGRGERRRIC